MTNKNKLLITPTNLLPIKVYLLTRPKNSSKIFKYVLKYSHSIIT